MDLFIRFYYGFAFWLEPIQTVNWALVPMDICWKIDLWWFFDFLTYLLNLLSMKELKPHVAVLFTTAFATIFAISLGKTD
jgi:hypothetical protein